MLNQSLVAAARAEWLTFFHDLFDKDFYDCFSGAQTHLMQVAALAGAALGAAVKELLTFGTNHEKPQAQNGSDEAACKVFEPCAVLTLCPTAGETPNPTVHPTPECLRTRLLVCPAKLPAMHSGSCRS